LLLLSSINFLGYLILLLWISLLISLYFYCIYNKNVIKLYNSVGLDNTSVVSSLRPNFGISILYYFPGINERISFATSFEYSKVEYYHTVVYEKLLSTNNAKELINEKQKLLDHGLLSAYTVVTDIRVTRKTKTRIIAIR